MRVGRTQDGARAVDEAAAHGHDLIKVVLHSGGPILDDATLVAVVHAAHRHRLPVGVHAEGRGQARRAFEAGADLLVHVPWTESLTDDLLVAMARSMLWISTFAIHSEAERERALDNARRFIRLGGRLYYGTDMGNDIHGGPMPVGLRPEEIIALGHAGLAGDSLLESLDRLIRRPPGDWRGCARPATTTAGRRGRRGLDEPCATTGRPAAGRCRGMTERLTGSTHLNPDSSGDLATRAELLDAADPLADFRDQFIGSDDPTIIAYLDGNSLGRPLRATRDRISGFVEEIWGRRLIRAWDEGWMDDPVRVGDDIGRVVLGAAAGQTVVGDSTSVMLYKWIRAASASQRGRDEIIVDVGNFPTDRFVVEGIADELGMRLRWLEADRRSGITVDQVTEVAGPRTALILLSDVAYRSGYLADVPAITATAHDHEALVLWDVCHSAGAIPRRLDDWGVDLAVGCTYKYLNGGPGSPAFGYVRADLQQALQQPIQGWMGSAQPFEMVKHYLPSDSIRRFISGTPSIIAMLAMQDMLALIEQADLEAIRAKSVALTDFAIQISDRLLSPLGVQLGSPRDAARRGSHITLEHPEFRVATQRLWERGVIPDFRPPDGLRIGLSPLSTSFREVFHGLAAVRDVLWEQAG